LYFITKEYHLYLQEYYKYLDELKTIIDEAIKFCYTNGIHEELVFDDPKYFVECEVKYKTFGFEPENINPSWDSNFIRVIYETYELNEVYEAKFIKEFKYRMEMEAPEVIFSNVTDYIYGGFDDLGTNNRFPYTIFEIDVEKMYKQWNKSKRNNPRV